LRTRSGRLDFGGWAARLEAAGVVAAWCAPLGVYLGMLERFGGALDLVGPGDAAGWIRAHVVESLAGVSLLGDRGSLLDVGSGAGLPGVPLLIAKPAWSGVLLEPRERRWAFLREVVREVGLDCEVRRERVSQARGSFDAMTVRAVAYEVWASEAVRLLRPAGRVLWWTAGEGLELAGASGLEPVVTSPLPQRERGSIVVWRRRST